MRVMWRVLILCSLATFAGAGQSLRIQVIEGEGAVNNIRLSRAKEPVVQVLDAAGKPVAGATVHFTLPQSGAGGVFAQGSKTTTATTDENGIAMARGLQPNRVAGAFEIRVTASHRGQTASAVIKQMNAEPVQAKGRGKKMAILAIIAGGAGAGFFAASRSSKQSGPAGSPGPASTGAVITPGAPTFAPPR